MHPRALTTLAALLLLGGCTTMATKATHEPAPAAAPQLATDDDRVSYAIGYQVGGDMQRQGVVLNSAALVKGVEDAIAGDEPRMSRAKMRTTLVDLKRRVTTVQRQKRAATAEESRAAGQAFLAQNANKEGVITRPSGLQYRVIKAGSGKSPGPTDTVTVRYRGTFIDGEEFDSTDRRGEPATFRLDRAIAGWQEALPLMKAGGHWQLFVPPELAYGSRGRMAGRTLLFDVELVSVK